jgi:adenylate kinase
MKKMAISNTKLILLSCSILLLNNIYSSQNIKPEGKILEEQKNKTEQTKTIFTFFAAPGAGKGTLAQQCADKLGYKVLSTGDLCRKHIATKTEFGKKIDEYTSGGGLVPDEIIIGMVKEWLKENKDIENIILDGFPRTKPQAEKLLELLKTELPNTKFRIIQLDLSEEEIIARLSGRRICPNQACKAVYNISMPEIKDGKCPKCGTRLIIRKDDQPEVLKERFHVYKKHEKELLDFYKDAGKKIETLNISNLNPSQVFDEFKKIA